VYKNCLEAGYPVDENPYERYDSLASRDDLDVLFNTLFSFRDFNGNHPIITANCVVANPDFEKIRDDNFLKYHFEVITETFGRYPNHSDNFKLWHTGLKSGLFFPQFHCREHLNVSMFMKALRNNDTDAHFGFRNSMPGSIRMSKTGNGNYFIEATNYNSEEDKSEKLNIYIEGLEIFEKLFGYKSISVIPPNYIWSNDFYEPIARKGVRIMQGSRKYKEPVPGHKPIFSRRILGDINDNDQISLIRNCTFEPSLISESDVVDSCLADISLAFRMGKPAIISSHRINYVGFIDQRNRDNTIKMLDLVLKNSLKHWPDLEFFTSVQLGELIYQSKKNNIL